MNLQMLAWLGLAALPILSLQQVDSCGSGDPDPTPPPETVVLSSTAQVSYDGDGVPHVSGQTVPDVVLIQGYLSARDRLWQMDLLRRKASGRMAEIFGEPAYSGDLHARTLDFPRWASAAFDSLKSSDPESVELLEAYATGVNAYIDAAAKGQGGASLPAQMVQAGYVPEPWSPVDSLSIDKMLAYGNSARHTDDLSLWLVAKIFGAARSADLVRISPLEPVAVVGDYYATEGSGPIAYAGSGNTGTGAEAPLSRDEMLHALEKLRSFEPLPGLAGGSAWVVSGEFTRDGAALLANDTHLNLEHPATFYQIQLNTKDQGGDLNVEGYSVPGLPLVLFGHTEKLAWGVTPNLADVSDVFLETVVGDSVLLDGKPVAMESRTVTILVRPAGGAVSQAESRTVTVKRVPHHGPVLSAELTGLTQTFSAAWTGWNDSSLVPVMLKMNHSSSGVELEAALGGLQTGALNVVYADSSGDIGYLAPARVPVREILDPAAPPYLVLPGTGSHEWTGQYVPLEALPQSHNPDAGYLLTASNDPAGLTFDNNLYNAPYLAAVSATLYLGGMYDAGPRASRLKTLLDAQLPGRDVTAEDLGSWQGDVQSRLAVRLLPYLFDAAARKPMLLTSSMQTALAQLQSFADEDHQCVASSQGCLMFHAWLAYVLPEMFADEGDASFFARLDSRELNFYSRPLLHFLDATRDIVDALDYQASGSCARSSTDPRCAVVFPSSSGQNYFDNVLTTGYTETRDEVLLNALSKAVSRQLTLYGSLSSRTWGDVHVLTLEDPAQHLGYSAATLGPFALDGASFGVDGAEGALMSGGAFVQKLEVTQGPGQRSVVSVGAEGMRSWEVLAGGQSERVGDPYFANQAEEYLQNQLHAQPFAQPEVSADQQMLMLFPAGFPDTSDIIVSQ